MDTEYLFDLDGGRVCLDFVNTRSHRTGEHLRSAADLAAFFRQAGVITAAPQDADAGLLERAHAVRAALFGIFSAVAAGRAAPARDLEVFNASLSNAMRQARVVPRGQEFGWAWAERTLEAGLWEVVRSAADLLTSPDLRRLRECGGADCAWLFLDTSKNRSRQWCSMQSCGNREKARRHYERVRARTASTTASTAN